MPVPFDIDMLAFLWINLKTIFSTKRRLRESTRRIPMQFAFEEVPVEKLTQAQKDYMKPIDDQLASLNYFPLATFRITNFNFGTTLHRRYSNPTDPVSCALSIIEVKVKVGEVESVRNTWNIEFATRFLDGRLLITRSKSMKSLFDQPPWRITQDCPNVTSVTALKRRHDARARELGPPRAAREGHCQNFRGAAGRARALFQFSTRAWNLQNCPGRGRLRYIRENPPPCPSQPLFAFRTAALCSETAILRTSRSGFPIVRHFEAWPHD